MIRLFNTISLSTILLLPIFLFSYYYFNNSIYLYGLVGISITLILTSIFKGVVFQNNLRPVGARDCNIFNNDGDVSKESGFPSGHTATASFFVFFYMYILYTSFKNGNISQKTFLSGSIGLLIYLLMIAFSRYEKKCHSISQILGGLLLGLGMSSLSLYCYSRINKLKSIKIF